MSGALAASPEAADATPAGPASTSAAPRTREGFARGLLVTAGCLGLSRFCGLGRELAVAARSGPSAEADAVYTALVFVTAATSVLAMSTPNVLARAFYAEPLDPEERRARIWACLARWSACLGAACLAIAALAWPLWGLLAGPTTPVLHAFGASALRYAAAILFLQGLFLPMAAIGNAEGWHTPVALLMTGFPLGGLFGALALLGPMGMPGLLAGIALASAAQVALAVGLLASRGLAPRPGAAWRGGAEFGRLAAMMAPVLAGAAVLKLDTVILARVAGGLEPGDVFLVSLAAMLVNVPMSVANQAVTMTAAPALVRERAAGASGRFGAAVVGSCELATLLVLPAAVLMVVDAEGLISAVFVRGRFGPESAGRVAGALQVWALASPLLVLTLALDEALMALGDRAAAARARALTVAAIVPGCLAGAAWGGLAGMVGAYAALSVARGPLSWARVARAAGEPAGRLWASQARVLAAGVLAGLAAWAAGSAASMAGAGAVARLSAEAAAVALTLPAAAVALGVDAARRALGRIRSRPAGGPVEARP